MSGKADPFWDNESNKVEDEKRLPKPQSILTPPDREEIQVADPGLIISGDGLSPDPKASKDERRWLFWTGIVDEFAQIHVAHVAGVEFPRGNQYVVPAKASTGFVKRTQRIDLLGALVPISAKNIQRIAERLPLCIARPAIGENGQRIYHTLRQRSKEECAEMRRRGYNGRPTSVHADDIPLAKALFCVPISAEEIKAGVRHRPAGSECPPPLSETGLVMPDAAPWDNRPILPPFGSPIPGTGI